MVDLKLVEITNDRAIAALVRMFATGARASTPAQVDSQLNSAYAADNFVDHVDSELGRGIGIPMLGTYFRIHEKAQMRIVDLRNVRASLADQFQFPA